VVVDFPGARDSTCAATGGFAEDVQGDDVTRISVEDLFVGGVCRGANSICVGLRTEVCYVC